MSSVWSTFVVLGAPLVIDADSFKTADGNLESSLKKYVMLFILKKYYTIKIRCCSKKNTAVVNYSSIKGSVELREIKLPEIGDHDVLLQVENVGVCGSDLHQWTSEHVGK